jgi:hypothetical protein
MKKLIATGATVATLLMATAVPAFALDAGNAVADDDSVATGGDVTVRYVDASQVQVGIQAQYGDATASGDDSTATVDSEQSITQNQANAGLGEIDDLNQGVDFVGDFFIF